MADVYVQSKDRYHDGSYSLSGQPGRLGVAVTLSDTKDVTNATGDNASSYAKALYVGVGGDLTVVHAGDFSNSAQGTPVTYKNVGVGWFLMQVRRVMATNTTASQIIGIYDG